jgi:hypothetical protein
VSVGLGETEQRLVAGMGEDRLEDLGRQVGADDDRQCRGRLTPPYLS